MHSLSLASHVAIQSAFIVAYRECLGAGSCQTISQYRQPWMGQREQQHYEEDTEKYLLCS
jgi:hypothetical protein